MLLGFNKYFLLNRGLSRRISYGIFRQGLKEMRLIIEIHTKCILLYVCLSKYEFISSFQEMAAQNIVLPELLNIICLFKLRIEMKETVIKWPIVLLYDTGRK